MSAEGALGGAPMVGGTPAPGSSAAPARRAPDRLSAAAKRLIDVLGAAGGLLLLGPFMLAIALWVRLDSPGPALFRQERLGRGGKTFAIVKFRTMRADADDRIHRDYVTRLLTDDDPPAGGDAGLYKLERDPRITRAGAWLRRTSLDELPQLVNVLRGEMSLVGPRPALAWEAELFEPHQRQRFDVLPGLTGLWQVSGRNTLTMREALDLDLEYVRRRGLLLDLLILARTVPSLLRPQAR